MKNLKKILFITTMTLLVYSCNTETQKQEKENQTEQKVAENVNFEGNYVNNSYSQRKEGYDWVAVIVSKESDNQLKIVVRSRADKRNLLAHLILLPKNLMKILTHRLFKIKK